MKKLLIGLLLLAGNRAAAQKQVLSRTIEIEVDPIAYALKGYSVHAIQNFKHLRVDLGLYGIEQPASFTGNKGFETMTRGAGLKVNYLIRDVQGFYTGIDAGYAVNEVRHTESGATDKGHHLSLGVHAGYRVFLFPRSNKWLSGFYLTPWAGISYNHVYDKIRLNDYKEGKTGYFATMHIGYRF